PPGRGRRAAAQPHLPFERSDRRRQPVQPHAGRAGRVFRAARSVPGVRDHRARRGAADVSRVPGRPRRGTGVILHVTPHLPPDQAANALLPAHLGAWAADAGIDVAYLAHPPRAGAPAPVAGPVTWSAPPQGGGILKTLRFTSLAASRRIARQAEPLLERATLVHLHSNGLLTEVM